MNVLVSFLCWVGLVGAGLAWKCAGAVDILHLVPGVFSSPSMSDDSRVSTGCVFEGRPADCLEQLHVVAIFCSVETRMEHTANNGLAGKVYVIPVTGSGTIPGALHYGAPGCSFFPPLRSAMGLSRGVRNHRLLRGAGTGTFGSGGKIRTPGLQVMSLASCHCSTPLESDYHTGSGRAEFGSVQVKVLRRCVRAFLPGAAVRWSARLIEPTEPDLSGFQAFVEVVAARGCRTFLRALEPVEFTEGHEVILPRYSQVRMA